jgi:uncharacterized protein YhbP (UPF0306 family)
VIERSKRPVASRRIAEAARRLLEDSTLCAFATVAPGARAHVNTAYFAWSPELDLVWLSEPRARHSRNIDANSSVAVAVYGPEQTWGGHDRGLQLFGTARVLDRTSSGTAEELYAARFPGYDPSAMSDYRFYKFRPRSLKVFDERELGAGVFVAARLARDRQPVWERTEIYRPAAD